MQEMGHGDMQPLVTGLGSVAGEGVLAQCMYRSRGANWRPRTPLNHLSPSLTHGCAMGWSFYGLEGGTAVRRDTNTLQHEGYLTPNAKIGLFLRYT